MKAPTSAIGLCLAASTWATVLPGRDNELTRIEARQSQKDFYTGAAGGGYDIQLFVSREEVSYGSMHPTEVIAQIDSHCDGGMCVNIPIEVPITKWNPIYSNVPNTKGLVSEGKLAIGFHGMYDDWMRHGLIETLQWFTMEGAKAARSEVKDIDVDGCETNLNPDAVNPFGCRTEQITIWYGPKTLRMHMTELPGQGKTPGKDIEIQMTVQEAPQPGVDICGPMMGVAGAAAGAIQPWLGAGVSTLAIFCIFSPK